MGDDNAIVGDLEEAYALTGPALAERLVAGLEQQRMGAAARGDAEVERAATLRLVAVHLENGARDPARDSLRQWLSRSPQDRDALYHLLQLDEAEEQWEAVASTCEHLVAVETGEAQVKMVMRLADACDRVGQPANAREGLERVYQAQPQVTEVRDRLWNLYEAIGAKQELATILVSEALANENQEEKFAQLRRAGGLFLSTGEGGVEKSIAPLEEAVRIKPDDHETTILLIDAYSATGRYAESGKLLEQAIAARGARRTPQLSELQHRMARLAAIAGDKQLQLQWLNVAFDSDRRNGQVVADLAYLAMELGELDLALSALRVVTVSKVDSPLTKGVAFLMQAKIAQQRGEGRRAVMWAHRAIEEDPTLAEAHQLIQELGGS
jgi:tetratricopeptide (TPR) repeat protein